MENEGGYHVEPHPLSIQALREGEYPGSDIVIEQTLSPGSNYDRFIVLYKSEGLKIYGLLTVPKKDLPQDGWSVIIFNHGYIPPLQYKTTQRYGAYMDVFSRNGYIVFKPDYRGHGNSEGVATGAYGSNAYMIDVLNAVSSIKKFPKINPEKIGMWGHSMGGLITLKVMVISKDVKAGVIWAGVVGSYQDLLERWRRRTTLILAANQVSERGRWRRELIEQYGDPTENPSFWSSISPNSYLSDISGPIQLHHGTGDTSVPFEFSQKLEQQMKDVGKEVEIYIYDSDDHNLSKNFSLAAERSVNFFNRFLK